MTALLAAGIVAAEWAGHVYASYGVVLAGIAAFAWRVLRRGRRLSQQVDDADKYWH